MGLALATREMETSVRITPPLPKRHRKPNKSANGEYNPNF